MPIMTTIIDTIRPIYYCDRLRVHRCDKLPLLNLPDAHIPGLFSVAASRCSWIGNSCELSLYCTSRSLSFSSMKFRNV